MLTHYIQKQLEKAHYKILEDGSYWGEIPGLNGVWADGSNLEACREMLQEVLEEWLILKLKDGDKIPGFSMKVSVKKKSLVSLEHA